MTSDSRQKQWQREAEFFDSQAKSRAGSLSRTDPAILERYARAQPGSWWPLEHAFGVLGKLEGKNVLDVGCGEGEDSILLAANGAKVKGIDISTLAIDLARDRAAINEVSDRTSFIAGPIENLAAGSERFDVIWCAAVLHHIIADLGPVLRMLRSLLNPGGRVIMIEPIMLSKTLKRLRRLFPANPNATPDERPLELNELEIIKSVFPELETRYFRMSGRFAPLVLGGHGYEKASKLRRAASDALGRVDRTLLSVKPMQRLASICVMEAQISNVVPGPRIEN